MENSYFYIDASGNQQGPVSAQTLTSCGINTSTLVWHAGMTDWLPAGQVDELKEIFQQTAGAMPPPNNSASTSGNSYSAGNNAWQGGYAGGYANTEMPFCPNDHMTSAIIVTVIWFIIGFNIFGLIPGIIAIVKADKVSSFYRMGQYNQALIASTEAGKWVKYSVIAGIISYVLLLFLVVFFVWFCALSAASFAATL